MDANLVINAILRHTMVLIAHLAVGPREPLGHIADQVLHQLADALEEQGLAKAIIADMFGMTLRNYRRRFNRDAASLQDQYLLRHEILVWIEAQGQARRVEVLDQFARGEARKAVSCLKDLVDMQMLARTGSGQETLYIPTSRAIRQGSYQDNERLDRLVQVVVFRMTPGAEPTTRDVINAELGLDDDELLDASLGRLTQSRVIMVEEDEAHGAVYTCDQCVVALEGEPEGWEAAVLDHYQAVVTALVTKLSQRLGDAPAPHDPVGGSTYTFGVWDGHPLEAEVLAFLDHVRNEATSLRNRVDEVNQQHKDDGAMPEDGLKRSVFYAGQVVKRLNR